MATKLFVVLGVLLALGETVRPPSYNMAPSRGAFGSGRNGGANRDRGALGADCEYDDDCPMDNSFCYMQMQCKCKRNYEPNTSRDTCVARIGADCRSRFDCSSLENSECRQNLCGCQDGFIPYQERVCLRLPARIGDPCEATDLCRVLGENAMCVNGRCQCSQTEHMADGKCYPNIPLRQACNNKNECYIGEGFQGMLQCRNGVCQCSSGYHETPERTCASGDGASSLQLSFFVLIASFLISIRWIRDFGN